MPIRGFFYVFWAPANAHQTHQFCIHAVASKCPRARYRLVSAAITLILQRLTGMLNEAPRPPTEIELRPSLAEVEAQRTQARGAADTPSRTPCGNPDTTLQQGAFKGYLPQSFRVDGSQHRSPPVFWVLLTKPGARDGCRAP